jgi:hypothetical protein
MEAANDWWRQKQEEIDRADPLVQARADLEVIKDQRRQPLQEAGPLDRRWQSRVPTACAGEDRVPGRISPKDVGRGFLTGGRVWRRAGRDGVRTPALMAEGMGNKGMG